jgi:hypothetical protein
VLRGGHRLAHPFLDLRSSVGFDGAERGMLSIAFPPDYATSKRFYVYYNDNAGNIRIDEFRRRTPTRAAPNCLATHCTRCMPIMSRKRSRRAPGPTPIGGKRDVVPPNLISMRSHHVVWQHVWSNRFQLDGRNGSRSG